MGDGASAFNLEESMARLFYVLRRQVRDEAVIQAMERVHRELFVPEMSRHLAYEDIPLPIGYGQTISQPYIVAVMTSALELKEGEKVLELGTGCGYQSAILAEMGCRVITVERIATLAEAAQRLLSSLGYGGRIDVHLSGKELGCPLDAPFDAIIVTAGSPKLPYSLLDQMKVGGRMVIPVGAWREQELMKVVKSQEGFSVKSLGPCRFVPLLGKNAWDEGHTHGGDAQ